LQILRNTLKRNRLYFYTKVYLDCDLLRIRKRKPMGFLFLAF
jgi:hypothetical protein